jgi:hypothetical protein
MKRTRMCFGRTDRAFTIGHSPPMWRGPDNMLHVFLTLMYPLEVESNLFIARFALHFIVYVFM